MRLTLMKGIAALSLVVAVGYPTTTKATLVTYNITGSFDKTGSNVFSAGTAGTNLVTVTFTGVTGLFVEVPPASFVDFGTFKTTAETNNFDFGSLAGNQDDFTLTITQTTPTATGGNPAVFQSQLHGLLKFTSSSAYVQFAKPLTQIVSFANGAVTYTIVSADSNTAGRVNLKSPSAGGSTTIQGEINAVPEPGTVAMALTGLPILGLAWMRRRKQQA